MSMIAAHLLLKVVGTSGTALKSDLAKEFAGLNMAYAPNLAAAKHMLGL